MKQVIKNETLGFLKRVGTVFSFLASFSQQVEAAPQNSKVSSPVPGFTSTPAPMQGLTVEIGTGHVLHLEKDIHEIFVANPEIADIQLNTPLAAYVLGKKAGTTTVFATNGEGKVTVQLTIQVTHNLAELRNILKTQYPQEVVQFTSLPDGIIMSGRVGSAATLKNIEDIAHRFLGAKEQIINNVTLAAPQQVLLKVKVAEVARTVLDKFGINWSAFAQSPAHFATGLMTGRNPLATAANTGAGLSTGIFAQNAADATLGSIGFQFNDKVTNFSGILDALNSEGLASVLAEPNLIAVSGETASFLAGGEFPYPVPQDNNITLVFKQYGISLAFTPTVRSGQSIRLHVRPEVSQLDTVNAQKITLNSTSGAVTVPAILTRRAETTVELGSGQSLAIAGLIQNTISNSLADLPGLADIPILGALFRSTSFQRNESELIIIITPYVVTPTNNPDTLRLPTDTLRHASNLETLFLQRLNRLKKDNPYEKRFMDAQKIRFEGAAGFYVK